MRESMLIEGIITRSLVWSAWACAGALKLTITPVITQANAPTDAKPRPRRGAPWAAWQRIQDGTSVVGIPTWRSLKGGRVRGLG